MAAPRDQELGVALAEYLLNQYTGRITQVTFTWSADLNAEEMSETDSYCFIAPNNYQHLRLGRTDWQEVTQLLITLYSRKGKYGDDSWVGERLAEWDNLLRDLREHELLGANKPMSIDMDDRFDFDVFHNYGRIKTEAVISFNNVEG